MNSENRTGQPPEEMTQLYLGLLHKGPSWTAEESPELLKRQRQHLALLQRLREEGKLLLAGPIPQGQKLRGILICRASSIVEARGYFEGDVHVQSGRLVLEIHPWLVASEDLQRTLSSS